MKKKYEWKLSSFAKGIDPNKAVKELNKIENVYGCLTPQNILEASSSEDSLFHNLFTWDDCLAANQYRLEQARRILNNISVSIISNGEQRAIPVYEVISTVEGRVYKHIDTFSPEDIAQIKERTVIELNMLRSKLSLYKQFELAILKVDELSSIILEA